MPKEEKDNLPMKMAKHQNRLIRTDVTSQISVFLCFHLHLSGNLFIYLEKFCAASLAKLK